MALLFSSPVLPGKMNDSGHSDDVYSNSHPSQNSSPSPEMYMDSQPQPLDFSIKAKKTADHDKTKHNESNTMDHASPIQDYAAAAMSHPYLFQHLHRQAGAKWIPEDACVLPGHRPPPCSMSPMAHSPIKQEHRSYSPMVQDSEPLAINAKLVAQLQANPTLLSKFQAMLKSKLNSEHKVKSRSPSPPAQAMAAHEQVHSAPAPYHQLPSLGLGGVSAGGFSAGGFSAGGHSAGGLAVGGFAGGLTAGDLAAAAAVSLGAVGPAPHSPYLPGPGLSSVGSMGNLHAASILASTSSFFGVQEESQQLAAQSNAEYDKFRQRYYQNRSKQKGRHANRNCKPSWRINYDAPANNSTDNNVPTDGDNNNNDVCNYNYGDNERLNGGEADKQSDSDEGYGGALGGARPKDLGPEPCPSTSSHNPGPSTSSSNPVRKRERQNGDIVKDQIYFERRRKNNEAAKRSRDARRIKEEEVYIRCNFLQQENTKLKCEIHALQIHTERLRSALIYGNPA